MAATGQKGSDNLLARPPVYALQPSDWYTAFSKAR
jgi:hypothetical protein